jgi:predicted RNA-binding Zn-ribbon protein involved in translation (DUF1610 family)
VTQCKCCGAEINDENKIVEHKCINCGGDMCDRCDQGRDVACNKCQEEDAIDAFANNNWPHSDYRGPVPY